MTTPTNSSGTSTVRCSTGSMSLPSTRLRDDFRFADHEFVAFAAHHFDQNRKLEFAAAHDDENVGRAGVFDAKRNIRQQFFLQALAQVARGNVLAFAAREGRSVDGELHGDRGFVDHDVRQRRGIDGVSDGLADGNAFDSGDGDDVARASVSVMSVRLRPEKVNSFVILRLVRACRRAWRCRRRRR